VGKEEEEEDEDEDEEEIGKERKKNKKNKRRYGRGRRGRRGIYLSSHEEYRFLFLFFFFGTVWGGEGINVRSRSGVYEHVVPILMKGKGGERTHYGVWVLWI
jgi:hypothetical protein